ncbi:MAG: hypothetical protein ACO3I0_11375 [Limisphaerales bacterium]
MIVYILIGVFVLGVGVAIALLVLKQDRKATQKNGGEGAGKEVSLDKLMVQKGRLEWQEIQNHARLDELLAVEGTTMGGTPSR